METVPGEELDPAEWVNAEPWCEHCGVRRRRHITYLVRRGGDGARQIGSRCLADYTGGCDPLRAVRQAEVLAEARREVVEAEGAARPVPPAPEEAWGLEEFLAHVAMATRADGFVAKSRTDGRLATGDVAWRAMVEGARLDGAAWAEAEAVVRWARGELAELAERSEYEDRVVWALSRPRLRERGRYLVASAIYAHERATAAVHLGEVGERVEAVLRVEAVAGKPTMQGRYGPVYYHRLRDQLGRLVVWSATGRRLERGARYWVRGTVRKHGRSGDEAATVIHRCRVEAAGGEG